MLHTTPRSNARFRSIHSHSLSLTHSLTLSILLFSPLGRAYRHDKWRHREFANQNEGARHQVSLTYNYSPFLPLPSHTQTLSLSLIYFLKLFGGWFPYSIYMNFLFSFSFIHTTNLRHNLTLYSLGADLPFIKQLRSAKSCVRMNRYLWNLWTHSRTRKSSFTN